MKYFFGLTICAALAFAAPAPTVTIEKKENIQARAACAAKVTLPPGSNPLASRTLHANSAYASKVTNAAAAITDETLKQKVLAVGKVGTFLWIDTISRIPVVAPTLAEARCTDILGLAIYDLPGRDCAAKASNGELQTGELSRYHKGHINPIVAALKAAPNVAVALITPRFGSSSTSPPHPFILRTSVAITVPPPLKIRSEHTF